MMKLNKWTLTLASLGVVSLASAAKADEKMSTAALSSTTISGYVDTSAQWNFGDNGSGLPPYAFGGPGKSDGFNLNVVQLTIAKPLEEGEWSAGYHVDLWAGPDANTLATTSSGPKLATSDFAIRQAYVNLRTPVGNGIDWKIGVFDTIIGYETLGSGDNPNFTRSYGFSVEPTTHTGLLGSYRVNDAVSFNAGVADTHGPTINSRAHPPQGPKSESFKTYMGSVALTAPSSWGWVSGSTLYAGVINGYSGSYGKEVSNWYVGATLATPVTGLKVGASFDDVEVHDHTSGETWVVGGYASYQATEKLSVHARGEYMKDRGAQDYFSSLNAETVEVTLTGQYDLWKNVISRAEFRWDHDASGAGAFGPSSNLRNAYMLAANIIYKF